VICGNGFETQCCNDTFVYAFTCGTMIFKFSCFIANWVSYSG